MNENLIVIPDITITKEKISKYGKIYTNFLINGTIRNQPISVRLNNDNNDKEKLAALFQNTASLQLAVRKPYNYHIIDENTKVFYAYSEPNGIVNLHLTFPTDAAILNKFIENAKRQYALAI